MPWYRYEDSQPTEVIRSGRRTVKYAGNWWTNEIDKLEIELKAEAVRKLSPSFDLALRKGKPLTFFIVPGYDSKGIWRRNRAKWRKVTTGDVEELYISEYGEDIWTRYDPDKIGSLSTNSVSTYYNWKELPAPLKRFILKEDIEERTQSIDPYMEKENI